jgi:hypothetical protein
MMGQKRLEVGVASIILWTVDFKFIRGTSGTLMSALASFMAYG